MENEEYKWYKVSEVRDMLSLSNSMVMRAIWRGDLKAQRFGKLWRVREDWLNEWTPIDLRKKG